MTASNESAVEEAPPAAAETADVAVKGGWYAVVIMALVVMLAQIDRNVISLMVQPIKRDLGLSDTQVSMLIALAFSATYPVVGQGP